MIKFGKDCELSYSRLLHESFPIFKIFLAGLYFVGFSLHALDVMNLRLNFSEMDYIWKSWILFLLIFDFIASAGLVLKRLWGEVAFNIVALAQLIYNRNIIFD